MVHNPKYKVHSFRGLLGDGGQDEINLERQNVNLAYRIVKLELVTTAPGVASPEHVVKVFREEQSSIDALIDFNNTDILAVGLYLENSGAWYGRTHTIFDNVLFSRNIYVTQADAGAGTLSCNYYLEIEEVPVGAATLMQIKLGTARRLIGAKMGA